MIVSSLFFKGRIILFIMVYHAKKNFSLLMIGQFISILGDRISTSVFLTIAGMIVMDSSSSYQSSIIIAFQISPFLIFGYLFGLMADLVEKRKILIYADVGRAITLIALMFFHDSLFFLYFCVFMIGFFTSMFEPAKKAILPFLVKRDSLVFFNKFFAFVEIFAMFIGLGVGAFLLSKIGVERALFWDACTYLFSLCLLLFIKYKDEDKVLEKSRKKFEGFKGIMVRHKNELKEGLVYLKSNTNVKYVIFNLIFFHFFTVALFASTIIDYSIRSFDVGKNILIIHGFEFSDMLVGSHTTFVFLFVAIGAMFAPVIKLLFSRVKDSILSVYVFLFGASLLFISSVMSLILPFKVFYILFFPIIFLIGIVAGLQYIRYTYLIHLNTEKEFMGRVVSVAEIVWSLALFVGILFGSFFNEIFSYKFGLILCGLVYLCGAGSFYFSKGKINW